jgi:hypothetical protein
MQIEPRSVLLTAGLVVLVSCSGPSSSPSPALTAGITLSGNILEVLPDGTRRPISARNVSVEVEVASPRDPQRGGSIPVAADGSYRLSGVPDGRFVKITGVDAGTSSGHRFCGSHTITHGDTKLDIPLFLPGASLPGPTLSGQVFTLVNGTRVPLVGTDVYYQSRAYGPDVSQSTDDDGRYNLCGIPQIAGSLYLVCANEALASSQPVDTSSGSAVIDIDATQFSACLISKK